MCWASSRPLPYHLLEIQYHVVEILLQRMEAIVVAIWIQRTIVSPVLGDRQLPLDLPIYAQLGSKTMHTKSSHRLGQQPQQTALVWISMILDYL